MQGTAAASYDVDELRPQTPDDEFARAYRDLFDRSMRLAYRMTRDVTLAEDTAAEALARAYARWGSVRRMDEPQAWVMRVTVNLVIDHARRHKIAAQSMPALVTSPADAQRFDEQVALRGALVAALASLPRRQREAIALRYLAELDEHAISKSLDITPSSVRTHVQRGLAALRQQLGATAEGSLSAAF